MGWPKDLKNSLLKSVLEAEEEEKRRVELKEKAGFTEEHKSAHRELAELYPAQHQLLTQVFHALATQMTAGGHDQVLTWALAAVPESLREHFLNELDAALRLMALSMRDAVSTACEPSKEAKLEEKDD